MLGRACPLAWLAARVGRGVGPLCLLLWLILGGCERREARAASPVIILPREPQQIDPRHVGDAYGLKISRLLFGSLMTIDPQTLDVMPDLAEALTLQGPTTYRVRLREGLRFADGSVLDAEDVVATFRALRDPRVGSRYASTYARIASVEAHGPREVVFALYAPHATFATDLEMPILRAEDAFSPRGSALVASGPYRLTRFDPSELVLRENVHYHLAPLRHPALRFVVIRDDNTRALRMMGGAGDLALNALPPLLLPLFLDNQAFRVASAPGVGTTYIGLNLTQPVLADVRVRKALAHAIDRETIIRYKLNGRARLATSWIVPGHWAHDPQCPKIDFDLQQASALLDAAGLMPDENGVRLSLTIRTGADRPVASTARVLAAMWRRIGVEVDVRPSETATLLADLARGRFEMTLMQMPEVFEPHVLSWFFASDRIPEEGAREGGNRWRLESAALDAVLERGRATPETRRRIPLYHEAQRILAAELPVIPLWHEDVVAVTSRRLSALEVPRDGRFGALFR